MHGCANDYVVVDALEGIAHERFAHSPIQAAGSLARLINDRRTGVGADGFVLILPESRSGSPAEFEMRMYNPDGSYSPMCGNALRCVAKRLVELGAGSPHRMTVRTGETVVPMRAVESDSEGKVLRVEADLGPPCLAPDAVPCTLPTGPEGDLRATSIELSSGSHNASVLSMGNPHCVLFLDEPATDELVATVGPQLECHEAFPERTNVEFVHVESDKRLHQRTWERGAGETHACGSGACAVAVAGALTGRCDREVTIQLLGGELDLHYRQADDHVLMTGPAVEVFTGVWTGKAC